jgi:hypothetical protein
MKADRGVPSIFSHLPHQKRGGCSGGRKLSKKMLKRKRRSKKKLRMARQAEASRVNRQAQQRRQILWVAKATEQETVHLLRRRLFDGIRERLRRGAFTVE